MLEKPCVFWLLLQNAIKCRACHLKKVRRWRVRLHAGFLDIRARTINCDLGGSDVAFIGFSNAGLDGFKGVALPFEHRRVGGCRTRRQPIWRAQ